MKKLYRVYIDYKLVLEGDDIYKIIIEFAKDYVSELNIEYDYTHEHQSGNIMIKSFYYNSEEKTKDNVNKPHHYVGDNGLEVEQVLQEFMPRYENAYVAHRIASAVEYVLRSPLKNGLEDLKKARKNLDQAIEYLEND